MKSLKPILAPVIMSVVLLTSVNASQCYEASIVKPTPFMGNDGEIFKLDDGSIWEVKHEYEYMYEYYPSVIVCPDKQIIVVEGTKLNVEQLK